MDLSAMIQALEDPALRLKLLGAAIVLLVLYLVARRFGSGGDPRKLALRQAARAEKNRSYREAADHYINAGEEEAAFNALVKANAWMEAATLAMQLGKRDRAASLYERAGKYVEAGRLLIDIRRFEDAAKLYARVGHDGEAAELFERLGQFETAAKHYSAAGQHERAAELFKKRKKYKEAAAAYMTAWEEDAPLLKDKKLEPRKREAIHKLAKRTAQMLDKAGRGEEAFALLNEIGELEGAAHLAAKLGRADDAARLLQAAGKADDAAALLEEAGQGDEAKRLRAEALVNAGDLVEAAKLYVEIGQFMSAAEHLATVGRVGDAARLAEKAENFAAAGKWWLKAKEGKRAAACFERAMDFDKAAQLYHRLGEGSKAIDMLVQARRYCDAAQALVQAGDVERATQVLAKVGPESGDAPRAAVLLGDIALKGGDSGSAIEHYARGLADQKVNAGNLEAFYRYSVLLQNSGHTEQAAKTLQQIGRYDPEFRDVRDRLKALKEQAGGAAPSATESPRSSAAKKRRYVILEELGRGGMGVVYKAMDRTLDRVVALKVLPKELTENTSAIKGFFREAKSAAALNHPNIVTVYDAGEEDGVYYIAMEFIQGLTLKQVLMHKGPFDWSLLLIVAGQVCKGLGYAHGHKIIHRDVKPSNLMWLGKEKLVKITDFGLAKVVQEVVNFQTVVGGTPHYMSPEQILGEEIDPRADLYSLGATLFELSTGQVPFPQGDIGYHHIHTPAPDPRTVRGDLPAGFAEVLNKLLDKDPNRRYGSAGEVLQALQALRQEGAA